MSEINFCINSEPIEKQEFYLVKTYNLSLLELLKNQHSFGEKYYVFYVRCNSSNSGREKNKFVIAKDYFIKNNTIYFTDYLDKKFIISEDKIKKWEYDNKLAIYIQTNKGMMACTFNETNDKYYNPETKLFE